MSLLKCDKPDSIFFLLNSLRRRPFPSFHSAISPSDKHPNSDAPILPLLGSVACLPPLARDLGGKCVSLPELFVKGGFTTQRSEATFSPSPQSHPVAFCSQDVLIFSGAPHTSYLAGRLTCKGGWGVISPRFRRRVRHAGYHLAHACIGEGEKSHLSFL